MTKFLVLALCVVLASAAVRREAPAASPLQDLEKHANELNKVINDALKQAASSKNVEQVQKKLKDGSDSVLQAVSSFSSSLQAALTDASGKAKQSLESATANLKKTVDDLKAQHPEVEQNAAQLQQRILDAVKAVATETQKVAKSVSENVEHTNKELAPKVRAAYDDFVKHATQVQESLHKAATKQ